MSAGATTRRATRACCNGCSAACTAWGTCNPSPTGTRLGQHAAQGQRGPRRGDGRDGRAAARLATDPAGRSCSGAPSSEALDDFAARQPARDAARLARQQRAARGWWSALAWPPRAASTPGAASARPTTGPASAPNCREVLELGARTGPRLADHRPEPLRRADGPVRAGHDLRQRWTACSATCGSGCRADPRGAGAPGRRDRDRAAGPVRGASAARSCASGDALLGFDFEAGRLDVSATRSAAACRGRAHDHALPRGRLPAGLMGTVHETGHGRYEQNLPRDWLGQPVARRARWACTRARA
jgi:hypothetical protein